MDNDYLQLDDESVNTFLGRFKKLSMDLGDGGNQGKKDFEGPINAGFGGTASIITDEMGSLSNAMFDFGSVFQKGTDGIFNADKISAAEFQKLEIPEDFIANAASDTSKHVNIFVDKNDGRSVNEGTKATAFNEIADNTVNKENLVDITGAQSTVENYNDESTIRGQSVLSNISMDETVEQKYSDDYSRKQEALGDISNNQTQEQELKDNYSVGEKALKDINNNTQTQEQTFKDNYVQNGTVLNSMNVNSVAPQTFTESSGTTSNSSNSNELNDELTKFATMTTLSEEEKRKREKEKENEVVEVDFNKFF